MRSFFPLFRFLVLSIVLVAVSSSCSTKKNTTASRAFHNLTAKYNYYFNANESYTNATKKVASTYSLNYTMPLPVLLVGDKQVASMVGGDMDRAITKCTDLINRHSITAKPEQKRGATTSKDRKFYNQNEFVKWAREAWLLIGKARVWKGAYMEATLTFEHIILQFPETPMWHEAQIWLARISIINNDFVGAEDRLRIISSNRKYPKNKYFTHLLESTWADFYFRQGNFEKILPHLKKSIDNAPDKSSRLRYTFLQAQVLQKQGNYSEASKVYQKVSKMNPPYEMNFNAKINLAATLQMAGKGLDMKKVLIKMARDEKNREYLDQIYFTLGEIERSAGNIDQAIEYFKLSAHSSVSNSHQKGISYLTLADYYFAKPQYTVAQAYYDSAYNALDETHPGYKILETKTLNLNKLVENLNIIDLEDSLQRVAKMSPKDRDAVIAQLIQKVREDEDRLKREEQEDRDRFAQFQQTQRTGRQMDQTQGGKWYFYNQSTLSFGMSEFQMKWGKRKLEDNWRRKNKRIVSDFGSVAQETADSSGVPKKVLDNKSREFYLQDLPMSDSLVLISQKRIEEAMFKVGQIYENDLKDYDEAIKAYERLTERFPESFYAIESYYNIYQIGRFNNKQAKAEGAKQTILSKYPGSRYALMLSNPNYIEELRQKQKQENEFYETTFNLYKTGKYSQAIENARKGLTEYKGSANEPLYQFILALSIGKTTDFKSFKDELSLLVERYPKAPVASTAKEMITFIDQREVQFATTQEVAKDGSTSTTTTETIAVSYLQPVGEHVFVAVVPKKSAINQLKFNVVSFNVDNFLNLNLTVNNQELSQFFELITVESFKDMKESMTYYNQIINEEGLMGKLSPDEYSLFVISRQNFEKLKEEKSVVNYLNFFRLYYK